MIRVAFNPYFAVRTVHYNKFLIRFLARVHGYLFQAEKIMSPSPAARNDITFLPWQEIEQLIMYTVFKGEDRGNE